MRRCFSRTTRARPSSAACAPRHWTMPSAWNACVTRCMGTTPSCVDSCATPRRCSSTKPRSTGSRMDEEQAGGAAPARRDRIQVIHLASGNAHKAQEFQRLADVSGLHLKIVPAIRMPEVVEDTGTFVGNARKKAQALQALLPSDAWVLADDSGVCVDELGGAPGVESAYFAGPQHDAAANLQKLTDVMRGVPAERRAASFFCVLLLRGPDGEGHSFE